MVRRALLAASACLALAAPSLAGAAERITVAGTGANQILLRALAQGFEKKNPGVQVDVPDSIGSGGGIKAAGEGKVELGRTARKLKDKEKAFGLSYVAFARTPAVIVAHPGIALKGVTAAQSAAAFSGKAKNWKELGGPDAKLRIVTRPEGEASLDALRAGVPGWKTLVITTESKVTDSDPETVAQVAETIGAIGFTAYDLAKDAKLTVFDLDGIKPVDARYPAHVEAALVYKADRLTGATKAFVDFVFSKAGAEIIRKLGSQPVAR